MANLSVYKVLSVPTAPYASNAFYIVKGADSAHVELYFSSQDGSALRRVFNEADITSLIGSSNASTASKLATARTIELIGDATGSVQFDGSGNVQLEMTLADTGVTAGEYTVFTVGSDGRITAARALTAADIPSLPGSKISSAISVDTSGNAATATALQTARKINGVDFDGSQDITINAVDSTARIAASEKGAAGGVAPLNAQGLIDTQYLPGSVDDIIDVADVASLPAQGEQGKLYVTVDETRVWRWSGSVWVEIATGTGVADEAVKLHTARKIALSGDATGEVSFNGTQDVTINVTLSDVVTAGTGAKVSFNSKGQVTGSQALAVSDIPQLDSTTVNSAAGLALVANDW